MHDAARIAALTYLGLLACDDAPTKLQPSLPAAAPAAASSPFPATTQSLRLTRTIAVRLTPGDDAKQIGTIAEDTRVAWKNAQTGRGCKAVWVELEPRGWICSDFVEPLAKPPSSVELPRLDRGEVVPGVYGKVTEAGATTWTPNSPEAPTAMTAGAPIVGSRMVRKWSEAAVAGTTYWKVSPRAPEYVAARSIDVHTPSLYQGTRLGDDTGLALPIGFVQPRQPGTHVASRELTVGGKPRRNLPARAVVPVLETSRDPAGNALAYRIGDREWIDAASLRVVEASAPPPLHDPGERWLDVDLDAQVLVAYEGDLPVYATLVTSGAKDTPTETGIFRMWKKVAETDMSGLSGEDPYAVATVPWTQYFDPRKGLALHASYWHDRFGTPRSHGCINLSPIDARWLYFFTDPQVPGGWTMAAGVAESPGSMIRIRSKLDPSPTVKGYAQVIEQARADRPR